MIQKLSRFFLLAFLFCACASPAFAHNPYFRPLTDWISFNGNEYRLEGWYGDGGITGDPVRIVLRNKVGDFSAVAPSAQSAAGFCPTIENCWGFGFNFGFPSFYKIDPGKILAVTPTNFADPDKSVDEFGFDHSYDYTMLPTAFISAAHIPMKLIILIVNCWFVLFIVQPLHKSFKVSGHTVIENFFLRFIIRLLLSIPTLVATGLLLALVFFYSQAPAVIIYGFVMYIVTGILRLVFGLRPKAPEMHIHHRPLPPHLSDTVPHSEDVIKRSSPHSHI